MRRLNKLMMVGLLIGTFAQAEGGHGGGPQFTDAQKACLDGILGAPGSQSERPTHEAFDAAADTCGIQRPSGPPPDGRKPQGDQTSTDSASVGASGIQ